MHVGCGTSALGASLALRGWDVINCDFCEEAVGALSGLHAMGLLGDSLGGRRSGQSEYVHVDVLSPPAEWHSAFDVVVEKGLADTLLFGSDMDSALRRASRYASAVNMMLRPGGVLLQLSDAPLEMRRQMLEAIWAERTEGTWEMSSQRTGVPPMSILVARKL